jgi:hypothetical protein
MSPGTFAVFSKFHLNTSKSPNVKVVCFVEGHNFHVEWHCLFGVEMGEKCKSTPRVTIHRRPESSQLGMQFVNSWLRKRPYALSRSCRGSRDLQLSYYSLGPHMCQNVRKTRSNSATLHCGGTRTRLDSVRSRRRARPPVTAVPHHTARRGRPWPAGPRAVDPLASHRLPPPLQGRHAPCAPWPGRADRAARPTVPLSYWVARRRRLAPIPRPW